MTDQETIDSYDLIARDYVQRWHDRSMLQRALNLFVDRLPQKSTVLDVGCGPGFDTVELQRRGLDVFGLDRSAGMLAAGRSHFSANFVLGDMRYLPVASAFDGLWVNASMLHIKRADVANTLAGFRRVLNPGGVVYLSMKRGSGSAWLKGSYGRQAKRYFTFWQPNELDEILQRVGFAILESWENEGENSHWLNRLLHL